MNSRDAAFAEKQGKRLMEKVSQTDIAMYLKVNEIIRGTIMRYQ